MEQVEAIDLDASVGYALKEASSALRTAMESSLRPLGMTVTHYACLELLGQRPGMSNSELARGAFVTRQTMNVLLQALERDGSVSRPDAAPAGRALPARLTPHGAHVLARATAAVRGVEVAMLRGIPDDDRQRLLGLLRGMTRALSSTGVPDA